MAGRTSTSWSPRRSRATATSCAPRAAELAHHFYEARHSLGGPSPPFAMRAEAADSAAASLAWEDARASSSARSSSTTCASRATPDDRCELLLQLGEMRLRAGHPDFSDGVRPGAPSSPAAAPAPARPGRDPLRGHYYEAGRDRPDADRAPARGAGGAEREEQDLRAACSPGSPRSCISRATWRPLAARPRRRSRSRRTRRRPGAGRPRSPATTCRCSTSRTSRAAGGSEELIADSTQIGDRDAALQKASRGGSSTWSRPATSTARRRPRELDAMAAGGPPAAVRSLRRWLVGRTFAQMEGRLEEAERLAAESARCAADGDRGRGERLRRAAVHDPARAGAPARAAARRGAVRRGHPALAPGGRRCRSAYLAGRDDESPAELERAWWRARRGAERLLLARDDVACWRGEREARPPESGRRCSTRRSRPTRAASCRWAMPADSARGAAARPAGSRPRRPRRRWPTWRPRSPSQAAGLRLFETQQNSRISLILSCCHFYHSFPFILLELIGSAGRLPDPASMHIRATIPPPPPPIELTPRLGWQVLIRVSGIVPTYPALESRSLNVRSGFPPVARRRRPVVHALHARRSSSRPRHLRGSPGS